MFLDAVFCCTNLKTAVEGLVLSSEALNDAVCAGVMPTGTVAVRGLIETRIPESSPTWPVPVFFLSASAVAIKLRTGMGFGKLLSDGAVYVSTFEPFVELVVHVPMLPPFTVWPEVHGAAFVGTGLGVAVVGSGVYTYVHVHTTVSVADPPTVAVKFSTCPATTVIAPGETDTVTTFAFELLPQPDITIAAPAAHTAKIEFLAIRQLMDDISLVNSPRKLSAGLPMLSR